MKEKEKLPCELLKYEDYKKIPEDVLKKILDIVKLELEFLLRNKIPPLPDLYKNWFLVFCHLYETNQHLTDLEIKGIYKKYFDDKKEIKNQKEEIKLCTEQINKVSEKIEINLLQILKSLETYQERIEEHKENIESKVKEITDELILEYLKKILHEIEELKKENGKQKNKLEFYKKEIARLRRELQLTKKEANLDYLTGIPNKRKFVRALEDFLRDLKEKKYPFSFIILDIDNFKNINDTYGHIAGDKVLKEVTTVLRFYLRANAIIGRLGGEEFGIILPGVKLEDAVKIAERIRKILENRKIKIGDKTINVTASFGVTQAKPDDTPETLINRADEGMYEAKRTGKNKVIPIM